MSGSQSCGCNVDYDGQRCRFDSTQAPTVDDRLEVARNRIDRLEAALNVALSWHDGRASGTQQLRTVELMGCAAVLADRTATS